jgi:S-DNA-T family DNA segregation ATPase FtsK/SpoIIIE
VKISRANEIKLIFLLAASLVVFISLLSFDAGDIKFLTSSPNISKGNIVGSVGAYLAWFLLFLIGYAAFAIPFFMALWGITYLLAEKGGKAYLRVFGIIFSVLATSSIFSLIGTGATAYRFRRGGIIGLIFSDFLLKYLGAAGTFIVIAVLFLLSFLITTDFLIFPFIGWIPKAFKALLTALRRVPSVIKKAKAPAPAGRPLKPLRPAPVSPLKIKPAKAVSPEKRSVAPEKEPTLPKKPYVMPSLELLASPPPLEEREIVGEDVDENSRILEETLQDFGIAAKVVGVSEGPVITMYELEPARGVTVNRITSLSDNIALAMKSVSIRVVAPIPGKGTIGVEVPKLKSSLVYLKEILESKEYNASDSKLKLVIGKDISGACIVGDLNDMPHLLIAGATGSGKTVCVNSIITTLLYNAPPEEIRFLMVDPKRVELAVFNDLPHLLAPVVTEPKKVSHALNWVVDEMERRYELFAELGVRNIDSYNKKAASENWSAIPYIIVVIDELADLMLVAQEKVENTITRLAQLSRAVGIHMIIATQRPSVDVITGVIKANFPARISFKVASKVDSRTVIDMNGAEKLLGKGDMLFIEPGNTKPIRAQGTLVGDEEIARVAAFIKSQRGPDFVEEILKAEEKPKFKKFDRDEIYEEAVKLVLETKQASVSMLQRRLGVGYTRAARLIDMMEDESIVGPYQGSKPREIMADKAVDKK